jgi:L-rhamnose mutarotase
MQRIAPPGSQENAYFRMVVSYWEMAAALVTSGVLNQELFFQTNGELLFVWERVRELLPAFRAMSKNPSSWRNLETVGNAFITRMEANGPEAYPTFQAMVRGAGAGR